MLCPSCGQRKARRVCPALSRTICPVCCGTKRLAEIQCPTDCRYLASAREHPAAVVRRRREADASRLMPTIHHLTERQYQLFFLFHALIAGHEPQGLARLLDSDVAEATGALAATLETAARGVIYEHMPQGPPSRALAESIKAMLEQMREQGATIYDGETAIVLRAIEQGARTLKAPDEGDAAYLNLVGRLIEATAPPQPQTGAAPAGAIILP